MKRLTLILAALVVLSISPVPAPTQGDGGGGGGGSCDTIWVHPYAFEPDPSNGNSFVQITTESTTCDTVTFGIHVGNHFHGAGAYGLSFIHVYLDKPQSHGTQYDPTFVSLTDGNIPYFHYLSGGDYGAAYAITIAIQGPTGYVDLPTTVAHLTIGKPRGTFCFRLEAHGDYIDTNTTQYFYAQNDWDDVGAGTINDESFCFGP